MHARRIAPLIGLVALLGMSWPVVAELAPLPPPPPPPATPAEAEEGLEPEIVIRPGPQETVVTEYRRNGRLYMIKVTPKWGVPYYLVDADGDGFLETHHGLGPGFLIPAWVLHRW